VRPLSTCDIVNCQSRGGVAQHCLASWRALCLRLLPQRFCPFFHVDHNHDKQLISKFLIATAMLLLQPHKSESCLVDSGPAQDASDPRAELAHTASPTPKEDKDVSDSEEDDWDTTEIPNTPYRKGFVITATRHEPLEPFGFGYDTDHPPEHPGWEKLSQVDYCLSRPPSADRIDPEVRKCLTITSTLRTGRHRGAQIVVVDHTMVAKIYDPLYYSALNEYGGHDDVVRNADRDYRCEAAAFEQLQNSIEAQAVTPVYYGTWSMEVETPVKQPSRKLFKHIRPVRFILMERIYGDCMINVDPDDLREEVRSIILKKAILAETLIWDAGVDHRDVCPRNVMILGAGYDDPDVPISDIQIEVKIIDFNIAQVATHPRYRDRLRYMGPSKFREKNWPSKLPSPIVTHHGQMMEFSARGWCSNERDGAEKWLWWQFHNDDRYAPVVWDPDNPGKDTPVYEEPPSAQHDTETSSDSGISISSHMEERNDNCNGSSLKHSETVENKTRKTDSDSKLDRPEPEADATEDEGCAMALQM
jgi:hypothetical protein